MAGGRADLGIKAGFKGESELGQTGEPANNVDVKEVSNL